MMSNDFLERNPYPKAFRWHPLNSGWTNRVKCIDCGKMTKPIYSMQLCKQCRLKRKAEARYLIEKKKREKS